MSTATKMSAKKSAVVAETKKATSKKVVEEELVEEEVEEVEADDVDGEVEEVEADDVDEEEAEEATTEKKKSKKVEYVCETLEEGLAELLRVDGELDQLSKYRRAVFKAYQKMVTKVFKQAKKRRAHTSDTPKEATGFVKAIPVPANFVAFHDEHLSSDAEFKKTFASFDATKDTPRTEITKMIYYYIRSNELYGTKEDGNQDKRTIIPDESLSQLLSIQEGETIGFNNFQSYVTRLYGSAVVAAEDDAEDDEEQEAAVEVVVSKSKGSKKPTSTSASKA